MKAIGRKSPDNTVVQHEAVLAQQHAVPTLADSKLRPAIDVQPVQELGSIRAEYLYLAQGRCVEDAHRLADDTTFARHRFMNILAGKGEVMRTPPGADILENGALR